MLSSLTAVVEQGTVVARVPRQAPARAGVCCRLLSSQFDSSRGFRAGFPDGSLVVHELANSLDEGCRLPNGCRTYHSSILATLQRSLCPCSTFSNPNDRNRRDAAVNTLRSDRLQFLQPPAQQGQG